MTLELAPAGELAADDLQERFLAAVKELTDGFSQVVAHIAAHPRHNEKLARATELLAAIEQAGEAARVMIAMLGQNEIDHATQLLELLERAAGVAKLLAEENVVKEGSIAGKPLRPAPRLVEEAGPEDEYGPAMPPSGDSSN